MLKRYVQGQPVIRAGHPENLECPVFYTQFERRGEVKPFKPRPKVAEVTANGRPLSKAEQAAERARKNAAVKAQYRLKRD